MKTLNFWMKKVGNFSKKYFNEEISIHICFESETTLELFYDSEEKTFGGSIIFMKDEFNPEDSWTILEIIDALQIVLSLRHFSEQIKIEHDGDRGGEYFDITIPEKVMERMLVEKAG